jgi:outer membrane protein assembly factor BamB
VFAGREGIVCFSHDGERLWEFALPDGETIAAPVAAAPNSTVFIRTAETVFAISERGDRLWSVAVPGADVPAVVALGNSTVTVTTGSGTLVNLDGDRGTERWKFTMPEGDRVTAAPRVANNSWIYVRGNARIYAVNSDGLPEWDEAF